MSIGTRELSDILNITSNLGPSIKKGSETAFDVIKKFFNKANLNKEITKQKVLIEKSKYDIGNIITKNNININNDKIKAELAKISKYESNINKYKKALKLVDKVPAKEFSMDDLNNLKNKVSGGAKNLLDKLIKTVNTSKGKSSLTKKTTSKKRSSKK